MRSSQVRYDIERKQALTLFNDFHDDNGDINK